MASQAKLATVHGWTVLMHPLFELQLNALIGKVEALKAKHPDNYTTKNDTKRLAAIEALVFDIKRSWHGVSRGVGFSRTDCPRSRRGLR
ncbi:MAG: type II toxin-antitoxin system YhaV family toxin, partial [Burkholderiaceae bacterium]